MPDLLVAAPDHAQILERARDYAEQVKGGVVLSTFNLALFINELADALDALLAERQQDKERIERLTAIADAAKEVYGPGKGSVPVRTWAELGAALAVEEDARPGKPETPGNSGAAVEEDAKNG